MSHQIHGNVLVELQNRGSNLSNPEKKTLIRHERRKEGWTYPLYEEPKQHDVAGRRSTAFHQTVRGREPGAHQVSERREQL